MPIALEIRSQPTCAVAGFGRVFYGASDRLYFSQVFLDDISVLGKCFQKNDPTAEVANDVLDTDGGEILLQESGAIIALARFQSGILAFCSKGVWYISGSDSGFTATNYSVNKISSYRIVGARAFTSLGSDILFAASDSLFLVSNNEFNVPKVESLTDFTIKSYWQDFVSEDIQMAYDEKKKQVFFLRCGCAKGRALLFDTRVGAFYPWELKGRTHEGVLYIPQRGVIFLGREDTASFVTSDLLSIVTSDAFTLLGPDESFVVLAQNIPNPIHRDYGTQVYDSFMTTNYETLGNYTRSKGIPLVNVFFRKTETEVTAGLEELVFDKPSACSMSILWDFDTASGQVSSPKSIYNPVPRGYAPAVNGVNSFDTGQTIVTYKDKIRGKGRAVQFRFEAEDEKSMSILGFSVQFSAKGRM